MSEKRALFTGITDLLSCPCKDVGLRLTDQTFDKEREKLPEE
jgi:hypothetical protein